MNVGILYSGGKDSNLALYYASKYFDVKCLITIIPKSSESMLFHYPNAELVKLQSKALGIPLVYEYSSNDEKSQMAIMKKLLKMAKDTYNIEGIVTGAVRSTYQASRFQKICKDLDLWCFNPLWLNEEEEIISNILELGFKVIIVRLAVYPLERKFLGKEINREFLEYLKKIKANLIGEGGEYETFVLYMPLFKKRIRIVKADKKFFDHEGELIIKEAILI